jgi:hypothetical protein
VSCGPATIAKLRLKKLSARTVIDHMLRSGALQDLNSEFKLARKVHAALRYADFVAAKKASMLDAIARDG